MREKKEKKLETLMKGIRIDFEYYFTDKYDEPQYFHTFPTYKINESFKKIFEILLLLYEKVKELEEKMQK